MNVLKKCYCNELMYIFLSICCHVLCLSCHVYCHVFIIYVSYYYMFSFHSLYTDDFIDVVVGKVKYMRCLYVCLLYIAIFHINSCYIFLSLLPLPLPLLILILIPLPLPLPSLTPYSATTRLTRLLLKKWTASLTFPLPSWSVVSRGLTWTIWWRGCGRHSISCAYTQRGGGVREGRGREEGRGKGRRKENSVQTAN